MKEIRQYGATFLVLGSGLLFASIVSLLFPPQPLNLIVISIDSVRADHLGLYGYSRETMPTLSAWAGDDAFIFTNYFATSYLTPISEASVQTGFYPFSNGVINFAATARPTIPLLAELLKERGYDTAAFGSSPEYQINLALKETFSRGFDTYEPFPTTTPATPRGQVKRTARTLSRPVEYALSWLSTRENTSAPFYLWLPFGAAHMPYFQGKPIHFTDASYAGPLATISYDEFGTLYGYLYDGKRYATTTNQNSPIIGDLTAEDLQYINDRYDDGLYFSDQMVAKLFSYLKSSGLDRTTIVVFESEHGETLGERGYVAHYDIYDETLHTPLVMHIPGMKGRRVDALMSGVDIMPTLLSALRLPPAQTDGKDYLPLMRGTSSVPPRDTILIARTPLWERVSGLLPDFTEVDDTEHFYDTGVRSDSLKLIHRISRAAQAKYGWWGMLTGVVVEPPEYELYDLKNDAGEKKNVYDLRKDDPEVRALKTTLDEYDKSIVEHMPGPTHSTVQPYF